MEEPTVRDLVEAIVKKLVDMPDKARVTEVAGTQTAILEIFCDPSDIGKVLGGGGNTIGALRYLCYAIGGKERVQYKLVVVEADRQYRARRDERYRGDT